MSDSSASCSVQRDDGLADVADLIAVYEQEVDELRAAVAGMSLEQLLARPIEGRWSTLEVVCHISDCEQVYADRMKRTMAMERPLLMGVDGDRYPGPLSYQQRDLAEELALVAMTRQQMARILRLACPDRWKRTAIHSETGMLTLRQILQHAVNHLRHHLPFIAEKRSAMRC